MAESITLREANQRFARLIRAVEEGREFIVTRRGNPVARIVPAVRDRRTLTPEQEAALADLEALAAEGHASDGTPFDRATLYDR
jgi:prevent-host-death family protein